MEFKKNDRLEIRIEDISTEGAGVGRVDGFTFFVKDTIPGDRVCAIATKVKKNYGFARLMEIIEPSPDRIEAPCPKHRACGGCQLMSMSYEGQLRFKHKKVRESLVRIGGFDPDFVDGILEPVNGMDCEGKTVPTRYRNKAQYPVGYNKSGGLITGFYAGRTHSIVENEDCLLGPEENSAIIEKILEYMREANVRPYDEVTGGGSIRHILLRKGFSTGEIMVCLVINGQKLRGKATLIEKLREYNEVIVPAHPGFGTIKSIGININTEKTNVILGDRTVTLWGNDHIKDLLSGLEFDISAKSFYQVNPVQTQKLYDKVASLAELSGREEVWDLYCGIGTIGLSVANKAGIVRGIEVVPEAIQDARKNARRNGITNVEFYVGPAETVFPRLMKGENYEGTDNNALFNQMPSENSENDSYSSPDIIIIDPPRKGCDEACLRAILKAAPEKIIYVSCDPATLSRDLKILCAEDYTLESATPYDLFPNTVHVETVCLLSRKAQ